MLTSWITDLKQNTDPDLKVFLIGNKSDLNSERQVKIDEAFNFMNKNQIYHFEETSAKCGINIEDIFKKAIYIIYDGYLKYLEANSNQLNTKSIYNTVNSKSITLRMDPNKIKERKESDIIQDKFCLC